MVSRKCMTQKLDTYSGKITRMPKALIAMRYASTCAAKPLSSEERKRW